MDLGIRGKKALIGGGTRGIGRAVAEALAAEGVNLEIIARHNTDLVAKELSQKYGVEVKGHGIDLSKSKDIDLLRREVGNIDILFTNVGGPKPGEIEDLTDEDWHQAYDLTLMSVVRLVKAFLPKRLGKSNSSNIYFCF